MVFIYINKVDTSFSFFLILSVCNFQLHLLYAAKQLCGCVAVASPVSLYAVGAVLQVLQGEVTKQRLAAFQVEQKEAVQSV